MNKTFLAMACAAMFASVPQQAEAQFFKKLGKALQDVGKTILSDDNSASSTTNTTTATTASAGASKGQGTQALANGATLMSALPGFAVEFKDVVWYRDFVSVDLLVTNNGSKAATVYSFNRRKATTASGAEVEVGSLDDGTEIHLDNCDITFEPGATKRISFSLFGLPTSGAKMGLLQLRTTMHEGSKGYVDYFVELRNLAIPAKGAVPTGAAAFTGVWTCGRVMANLDIAASGVEDPNAMDAGEPCQGTIKVTDKAGNSTYYTVYDAKVTGSKCSFKLDGDYVAEGNATGTAELMSDNGMVLHLPPVRATMDGRLFQAQYITPSAGPFCGVWKLKSNDMEATMRLNAYDKSLSIPVDGEFGKGNGIVWLNMGIKSDECHITECKVKGNVAYIEFDSDRSGGRHKATLTYDPSKRTITVGNAEAIGDGAGECYLFDGLVFKR